MKIKVGDEVEVLDSGLLQMMAICPNMPPNNLGIVKEIDYGGDPQEVLIEFPIGEDDIEEHSQVAPYPARLVRFKKWRKT